MVTFLLIKPRTILLLTGVYLLTYHSSYSIVTRRILWKLKIVRLIFFYLTGLDLSETKNHSLLLPHLQRSAAVAHLQSQTNLFDSHTSYTRIKESGWVLAGQAIYCPMKELHGLMSFE